mmetsp:Transcript_4016/g.4515  ORF Transcript_4016/g.4515 Transcript_4016/m.4515 type:complete len:109 (+) Transcript_4016:52-378(+)
MVMLEFSSNWMQSTKAMMVVHHQNQQIEQVEPQLRNDEVEFKGRLEEKNRLRSFIAFNRSNLSCLIQWNPNSNLLLPASFLNRIIQTNHKAKDIMFHDAQGISLTWKD